MNKKSAAAVVEPLNPSPKARRFTDDFKRDSVRLVTDGEVHFSSGDGGQRQSEEPA